MNILIDIGHPAHVHLFKNFAWQMQKKGHKLLFTCRDKEFEIELLSNYGFIFKSFGKKYSSRVGKLWGLVEFDIKEILTGLGFKPDVFLSHGSIYAAHAAFFLCKPHISFEDTFNFEQIRFYLPFTSVLLTGDYPHPSLGKKEIRYAGYHELAYLHPNRFKPDPSILNVLGIVNDEKYVILRFIAWAASHDYGHKGINQTNKSKAVNQFKQYAKVFISSEMELDDDLKPFKLNIPPDKLHDALAFSSLLFGESSTMAEESAMLGIPSIFLNDQNTFYTKHLETDHHLMFNYSGSDLDQSKAISKGIELLKSDNNPDWQKRRDKMLAEKIDVTSFLVWFVENYPSSAELMRQNPDYQNSFR